MYVMKVIQDFICNQYHEKNWKILFFATSKPRAKCQIWLGGHYCQFPSPVPRPPPPVLFKLRALKPDQGLSSLTRGFQGRPGASKPDMDGHFGHFQISDFGFQILDVRFQITDFKFWISVDFSRFQITDYRFWISDFEFQISDFGFRFWISDFGFQILNFRF